MPPFHAEEENTMKKITRFLFCTFVAIMLMGTAISATACHQKEEYPSVPEATEPQPTGEIIPTVDRQKELKDAKKDTLFDAVSGDPLELCVKIAAYYGLRRSEVLGLRWSAIDMEHKTISISHKVIEAEVDGKFVPMGEDVLKTKSSFRTLPLIPAVGIILLEEKEKQEMYRRLFKKSYCRDYLDYICVDQCGKLLRPNYVTEHFSWLIEKYGLRKVRFHDLRHTCASLLLSNGISMKQIQIWLGHSTFSTTADIYAHLDYSAQEASANAMNGMFNRPEKEEHLA